MKKRGIRNYVFTLKCESQEAAQEDERAEETILLKKRFKKLVRNRRVRYVVFQMEEGNNRKQEDECEDEGNDIEASSMGRRGNNAPAGGSAVGGGGEEVEEANESDDESGYFHYQGYVELNDCYSIVRCKKYIFGSVKSPVHLERRYGSQKEAIDYCCKEDTRVDGPWMYGSRKRMPKEDYYSALTNEKLKTLDIYDMFPKEYLRTMKNANKIRKLNQSERKHKMENIYLFGETGTGKSFLANNLFPGAYCAELPERGGNWWFDMYENEEYVIIDEFAGQVAMEKMNRFLDRYPLRLQEKGGFVNFNSKGIIILSNHRIESLYKDKLELDPKTWLRRWKEYGNVYSLRKLRTEEELNEYIGNFLKDENYNMAYNEYFDENKNEFEKRFVRVRRNILVGLREEWENGIETINDKINKEYKVDGNWKKEFSEKEIKVIEKSIEKTKEMLVEVIVEEMDDKEKMYYKVSFYEEEVDMNSYDIGIFGN